MIAHLNPNVFLIFQSDGVVLWDFERHSQYLLAPEYAQRLLEFAYENRAIAQDDKTDRDLQDQKIIWEHPFPQTEWGWDPLARIFHVGTKDLRQDLMPASDREWAVCHTALCIETIKQEIPPFRHVPAGPTTPLPKPDLSTLSSKSLWQTLLDRRTCRQFRQEPVSLQTLSNILYASFGFLSEREAQINEFVPKYLRQRRSSPSGGGLNATEIYLFSLHVHGLDAGTYHYDPADHSL